MKNGNFIPKWGVNDHQICNVKIFVTPKEAIYNNGGHFRDYSHSM